MAIDFNVEPYYDDYSESKKFHRILFRPGYAVQARELTQLQTILQKQIERMGNHVFKEGAMVIPGQISYDTSLSYVMLQATYGTADVSSFIGNIVGKTVRGQTTGVEAVIVQTSKASASEPNMIFVKYTRSGLDTGVEDGSQKTFILNEVLQTVEASELDSYSFQVLASNGVNPAIGTCSAAAIDRGVYYIRGNFVLVEAQTVVLSKFSNNATGKVGLEITESIVEPEDDESLLDNAQSSYNYAAPGAHRYAIDAKLVIKSLAFENNENFIELLRLNKGVIDFIVNRTQYAVLEDNMARRTYDESGNYVVRDFTYELREYRNNSRGNWAANRFYLQGDVVKDGTLFYVALNSGISSSVGSLSLDTSVEWQQQDTPFFNRGVYTPAVTETQAQAEANESKLSLGIKNGKAYVLGYEIEKLGTSFVDVPKARETSSVEDLLVTPNYGSYVLVNNVNYLPDISSLPTVTIYNRYTTTQGQTPVGATAIGTARVRGFELHESGVNPTYKLFLFDIKTTSDFILNAKQFYIAGTNPNKTFTADAAIDEQIMTGAITFTAASPTTTIVGVNTRFIEEFEVGDFIFLSNATRRITSIIDNLTLTIDSAVGTQTGAPVIKCKSLLNESTNTSMIFSLQNNYIKTVSEITYYVNRFFSAQQSSVAVGSNCTIVLTTSSATEQFTNPSETGNYVIFDETTGDAASFTAVRSNNNNTITFTLAAALAQRTFSIIATVARQRINGLKTKTVSTHTVQFTTATAAQAKRIYLGRPDGIRIRSIKMKSGTFAAPGSTYTIDVKSRYVFNTGQTSSYYGNAFIDLKTGQSAPAAPIEVVFDYFEHVGSGDFFTADSYPNYREILAPLRGSIDFRPRCDDSTTGAVVFSGGNDLIPKYGEDILVSYEYYMPRYTKISLNKTGNIEIINGISQNNPKLPPDSKDSMNICNLLLEPYTFTPDSSVSLNKVDNRRYTMRDIARIENRMSQLEQYTTLSLLEQDTKNFMIRDEFGNERFKNGFMADNFKSTTLCNMNSPDQTCAFDVENGVIRPTYAMECIDFVETYAPGESRPSYQVTGDLVTLPYTSISHIDQPKASETINVNHYNFFTFIGQVEVVPPVDRWFKYDNVRTINALDTSEYDMFKRGLELQGYKFDAYTGVGSHFLWEQWQSVWTGRVTKDFYVDITRSGSPWGMGDGFTWNGKNSWTVDPRVVYGAINELEIFRSVTPVTSSDEVLLEAILLGTRDGFATNYRLDATQTTYENIRRDYRLTYRDEVTGSSTITLSREVLKYIRSRDIIIKARGLKPNTRYYPFFEAQNVGHRCEPAKVITVTRTSMTDPNFDDSTDAGFYQKQKARRTDIATADASIGVGDVLFVNKRGASTYTAVDNTPGTCVVVGYSDKYIVSGVVYQDIYVVNPKSAIAQNATAEFLVGDTVKGSLSGVTAVITAVPSNINVSARGTALITDRNGYFFAKFNIPFEDSEKFTTGVKQIALLDIATYNLNAAGSHAIGQYEAIGYREETQTTITHVRRANLESTDSTVQLNSYSDFVYNRNSPSYNSFYYIDPLAQTFMFNAYPDDALSSAPSTSSTGGFITEVDLYFATKDPVQPVFIQIRTVENGLPTKVVLPFSTVEKKPSEVSVSANGSLATTFKFKSPVFLENGAEYAIVVLTRATDKYKVWASRLSGIDTITGSRIDKQPYAGSLLKSQNASTWTPEQEMDIKFTIRRAKFTTGSVGVVEFENVPNPFKQLRVDPLQFKSGSNKMRVLCEDHGLLLNSKVTLVPDNELAAGTISVAYNSTAVTGTSTSFNSQTAAGCVIFTPDNQVIGTVSTVTSQTVLVLSSASQTAYTGPYRVVYPIFGISPIDIFKQHTITESPRELDSFVVTLSASSNATATGGAFVACSRNINFNIIRPNIFAEAYDKTNVTFSFRGHTGRSIDGSEAAYSRSTYVPIVPDANNYFSAVHTVASEENEILNTLNASSRVGKLNSAVIRAEITSQIDTLSPVIDLKGVTAIAVANKINSPSTAINFSGIDETTIVSSVASSAYTILTNTITFDNTNSNVEKFTSLRSGQFIVVTGTSGGSKEVLLTNIVITSGTSAVLTVSESLSSLSGSITVVAKERYFSETTPFGSSTYSKYVTKEIQFINPSTFLKIRFIASVPSECEVKTYYKLGLLSSSESMSEVEFIEAPANIPKENTGGFRDVTIDLENLEPFVSVVVKLVMTSTNSSKVPLVSDLRIIACA